MPQLQRGVSPKYRSPPIFQLLTLLNKQTNKQTYYPSMKKKTKSGSLKTKAMIWVYVTNNSKPYLGPWLTAGLNRLNHMNPRG